jgi:hypothetical protein
MRPAKAIERDIEAEVMKRLAKSGNGFCWASGVCIDAWKNVKDSHGVGP